MMGVGEKALTWFPGGWYLRGAVGSKRVEFLSLRVGAPQGRTTVAREEKKDSTRWRP